MTFSMMTVTIRRKVLLTLQIHALNLGQVFAYQKQCVRYFRLVAMVEEKLAIQQTYK